jgi:hypothetical protein
MQHGQYIQELESVAWERGYVFGHTSLAVLIDQIDIAKISEYSFSDRGLFYYELIKQLKPDPQRKRVRRKELLRETDARSITEKMRTKAKNRTLPDKVRDIWCRLFIAGCP